jgi:hypothetical protein
LGRWERKVGKEEWLGMKVRKDRKEGRLGRWVRKEGRKIRKDWDEGLGRKVRIKG